MRVPGFDFHPLRGFDPPRYSVHVNGPWCITFEFDGENAAKVDQRTITVEVLNAGLTLAPPGSR